MQINNLINIYTPQAIQDMVSHPTVSLGLSLLGGLAGSFLMERVQKIDHGLEKDSVRSNLELIFAATIFAGFSLYANSEVEIGAYLAGRTAYAIWDIYKEDQFTRKEKVFLSGMTAAIGAGLLFFTNARLFSNTRSLLNCLFGSTYELIVGTKILETGTLCDPLNPHSNPLLYRHIHGN